MRVSKSTLITGVAGSPIAHSLSPVLHGAWIEASGRDAVYLPFEPRDFKAFANGLRGAIRGLNVTAPFKQQALEVADSISSRAVRAQAANVLVFERNGEIRADNTDGVGMLAALANQASGFDPKAGPAVILGAGGAARGAAAAFLDAGAPSVWVANRTIDRALALAADFPGKVNFLSSENLPEGLKDANVVINATSADPKIPFEAAANRTVIMDMVYRPLSTPFLARARSRGLRVVDGLAMLIGQARPSFETFFGLPPPDIDVRSRALAVLEERA